MLPEINGLPIVVGRIVPGVEHCFDSPAEVRQLARATVPK